MGRIVLSRVADIDVRARKSDDGWIADVDVRDRARTRHVVRVSQGELERYGGGDVEQLVRRSFDFLLEREPNTSILREFSLSTIESYFPEYAAKIRA
jgi:hypothetical protein